MTSKGRHCRSSNFTDEETEAQVGDITFLQEGLELTFALYVQTLEHWFLSLAPCDMCLRGRDTWQRKKSIAATIIIEATNYPHRLPPSRVH